MKKLKTKIKADEYLQHTCNYLKEKTVAVLYSGGVDSSAICALYKSLGNTVVPVYFNDDSQYWHTRRKVAITRTLQSLDLFHTSVEMRIYEYEKLRITSDTFGFIPGLKMIMQMQLMAYCQRFNIDYILTGYNKENLDYPYTFKDELQNNISMMADVYNEIYDSSIEVFSPFKNITKPKIISLSQELSPKLDLKNTYSCKDTRHGGLIHCGKCWGCWSRSSSFIEAGVMDETIYAQTPVKPTSAIVAGKGAVVVRDSNV